MIRKELGMTIMKVFGRERLLVEGMRKQEALRMKKLLVNRMMKTINQKVVGELKLQSYCSCGQDLRELDESRCLFPGDHCH